MSVFDSTNANTGYNANSMQREGTKPLFQPALNRYVLSVAKPRLGLSQFAQKVKVPKGKGNIVTWDKCDPLPVSTEPLVEGVVPQGTQLSMKRVTAEVKQYGKYIATTDEFDYYKVDPSPEALKIGERLADNGAETFEALLRNAVGSFGHIQYAGGAESIEQANSKVITLEEIKKAVRWLKKNKAIKFNGKHFICALDPETSYDLQNDELWKNIKIHDPADLYAGEIGELFGVRFIELTETEYEELRAMNQSKNTDVHAVYVFGEESFGSVDPDDNIETITHNKGEIGGPLDQFSTMGWKGKHVGKMLTPEWFVEINCGVSK